MGTTPTLRSRLRARGWRHVFACLDARMREVYVASYVRVDDAWRESSAPAVMAPAAIRREPSPAPPDWFGAGNGFAAYPALAAQLLLADTALDAHPTARSIGELALPRFAAGEGVAAVDAVPVYVRERVALTAAEQAQGVRL